MKFLSRKWISLSSNRKWNRQKIPNSEVSKYGEQNCRKNARLIWCKGRIKRTAQPGMRRNIRQSNPARPVVNHYKFKGEFMNFLLIIHFRRYHSSPISFIITIIINTWTSLIIPTIVNSSLIHSVASAFIIHNTTTITRSSSPIIINQYKFIGELINFLLIIQFHPYYSLPISLSSLTILHHHHHSHYHH